MTARDRVSALWAAFLRGDAHGTLDHVHEECEWVPPDGRTINGCQAIRGHLDRLRRDGVRLEPTLHSCEAVGEAVVVCGRLRVVSRSALTDSPLFWIYRLRDEQVVRVESYASRRDALAAV